MKNETKVLFAGGIGAIVALGLWFAKRKWWKKDLEFCYYDDFHKQFNANASREDFQHGVEYLHVQ